MTREIKFRGKRTDNGEWVYGWLWKSHDGGCWIRTFDIGDDNKVDPKTVGQYIGLKDKKNVEIYEGGIFNCIYERDGHTDHKYIVEFGEITAGFILKRIGKPCSQTGVRQTMTDASKNEVIGNIYENPELLK